MVSLQCTDQWRVHPVRILIMAAIVCGCSVASVLSDPLQPHGLQPARLLCSWDSPGKNTGASCHFLFQGIFPTQGLNLSLTWPALAGRFFTTSATWEHSSHFQLSALWTSLEKIIKAGILKSHDKRSPDKTDLLS